MEAEARRSNESPSFDAEGMSPVKENTGYLSPKQRERMRIKEAYMETVNEAIVTVRGEKQTSNLLKNTNKQVVAVNNEYVYKEMLTKQEMSRTKKL